MEDALISMDEVGGSRPVARIRSPSSIDGDSEGASDMSSSEELELES